MMIWVHSEAEAWEAAKVVSDDGESVTVRLQSTDKTVTISGGVGSHDTILPGSLSERCDNLVELESFCEGIILHHVQKRFFEDSIYTFVGSILIALNPYKTIAPLYGQPVLDEAFQRVKSGQTPPTHIFSVAALAVHSMLVENKNQSVLISGIYLYFTFIILYLLLLPLYQASRGRGRRKAPSASCSSSPPLVGALPVEPVSMDG
jgi:myosin heavy subunit